MSDLNDRDINAELLEAVKNVHKEVVEALLKEGAKVDAKDNNGDTPLHGAAYNGHKEVAEALLKEGANVNAAGMYKYTALHLAAKYGRVEVVKELLKAKGIDVNARDEDGNTPFDLAGEKIKTLLQNAEKTDPVDESSIDSKGDQEEDAGVQDNGVNHVAPIEPAQTEEQPSSFFGSLFSILMKPFSLIASFFGGFFFMRPAANQAIKKRKGG